jgi:DNA-binding transcriptional MerR regulator
MSKAFYTIKDIENLTGVKAHTLRVWEQRYHLIEPKRTENNIRYYDADDLKFMLNVAFLNQHGHKISRIAQMNSDELIQLVRTTLSQISFNQHQVNALVVAMVDLDEEHFEKIISTNILQMGFEKTMTQIIYPFLYRVGILWTTNAISPAHEHFISGLIRNKIIVAIDGQMPDKNPREKKFMLYLPSEEWHEIPLLFSYYVLKSRGHKVYYLGQNLPLNDVLAAYQVQKPHYLLSIFTTKPACDDVAEYIKKISNGLPDAQILLTGKQIFQHETGIIPSNVQFLYSVDDLLKLAENS